MGRSRYRIHAPDAPHFLTCTVVGGLPLFARPAAAAVVLDVLRFLQAEERLTLYAYVLMVNHLHLQGISWLPAGTYFLRIGVPFYLDAKRH